MEEALAKEFFLKLLGAGFSRGECLIVDHSLKVGTNSKNNKDYYLINLTSQFVLTKTDVDRIIAGHDLTQDDIDKFLIQLLEKWK